MQIRSPHRASAGFTLPEIVLAIGLAAAFMAGIFTVLSSGITSSSDAANDARVSLILRDVSQRMRGVPFLKEGESEKDVFEDPQYYDANGVWVDRTNPAEAKSSVYKVIAKKAWPKDQPDPHTNMMTVRVEIYWPIDLDGKVLSAGGKPKAKFSYQIAPLTGRGWTDIDPDYVPKIEG
jgi:uncharacterized protein (TIGR02598 family)